MVTKLYIDNYKGFVDFHVDFGRIVFLMGRNGSGKSSLLEVLHSLAMVIHEGNVEDYFNWDTRFRYADNPEQRFRLNVERNGINYRYDLDLSFPFHEGRPIVAREELTADGVKLFLCQGGKVSLFDDRGVERSSFPIDPHRGGLSIVEGVTTGDLLGDSLGFFKLWAEGFLLLSLAPADVKPTSRKAAEALEVDGANFAAWYEFASNDDTESAEAYRRAMQRVIPGLRTINLRGMYKAGKLWEAKFEIAGTERGFALDELSEGEISLAVYYALIHFCVRRGMTVALDEPDNFLALAEIEPFAYELEDAAAAGRAQVFVVSHHPEFYAHWARDWNTCRYFERSDDGKFAVRTIDWDEYPGLTPAEVVARGWQDA